MQYYVPFGQIPVPPFPGAAAAPSIWGILVRSANPDALIAPMQRLLQSPSTGATLATVRPLQDSLERQIRPFVLGAAMFSVFGLLALVLAAIGLYGVRAHAVTQRTREMGVRIALGATAAQVVRLVVLEGVKLALAGAAAGAVVVIALGNRLDPLLFQTSLRSPLLLITVGGILALVATLASAIPAWRASRVDAQIALRSE
jgi:ABC-type antimicrobial peptide transport system permease subunit